MNKLVIRIIASALAVSMIMPLAACKKKTEDGKSRSGKKIKDDMPWYDANYLDIDVEFDKSREIDYTYSRLAGADKDNIVILTTGNYRIPDNLDWSQYNYNDYAISVLTVFNRDSMQTVQNIDLSASLSANDYVENAIYDRGTITAMISSYDEQTYEMVRKEVDYDAVTGNQTASRKSEYTDGNIERSFRIGEYRVDTEMHWDERSWYTLYIYSDGVKKTLDLKDDKKEYYDIPVVIPMSDKTALIPVSTDGDNLYFELNLETATVTERDAKEYDWLTSADIYSPFSGSDGNIYFSTSTGISTVDFKSKSMTEVLNFSWCGISRNKLTNLEIADYSKDSFLLVGQFYSSAAFSDDYQEQFYVLELTKADKNPHAGKTILELYSTWGYTPEAVSDAILEFNQTNGDYFIEVTDRYGDNIDGSYYENANSDDDYNIAQLNVDSEMSNQLAMDIMNGEGPDILMDVSSYGQLNNTNYLVDLTPYVGSLGSDKYFTNVIDAAKVDGKLYNLPIAFRVDGIQTDAKYAGKSGVGFTTKEYEDFLNNTLNGQDIIPSGQAVYFTTLFNNMSEKFIVDGKADFHGSEFAELAEFVKNNVPESARSWDDYTEESYVYAVGAAAFKGDRTSTDSIAVYISCYGYTGYIMGIAQLNGGSAILGIPSTDGRGPIIASQTSVAISAQAYDVDACGEFVKMLISDDIQKEMALNDNLVLNREAFREAGKVAIDYYNGDGGRGMFDYDWNTGMPLDERRTFSQSTIDDLEKIIDSCSTMETPDAAINLILIEEMPAYFSGQKDLDSVITIAQDRVQKVLSERG